MHKTHQLSCVFVLDRCKESGEESGPAVIQYMNCAGSLSTFLVFVSCFQRSYHYCSLVTKLWGLQRLHELSSYSTVICSVHYSDGSSIPNYFTITCIIVLWVGGWRWLGTYKLVRFYRDKKCIFMISAQQEQLWIYSCTSFKVYYF